MTSSAEAFWKGVSHINSSDLHDGTLPANNSICAQLFIPNPDISGIGYLYGFIIQCSVTTLLSLWLLIACPPSRNTAKYDNKRQQHFAGIALQNSFVPKLANGAALIVAACLQYEKGRTSNRHLRTALALCSLTGAQAAMIMTLLFRNFTRNHRWLGWLTIYLAAVGVMTWRTASSLMKTGRDEQYCTADSLRNQRWGEYTWAMATVIGTPVWLVLVSIVALFSNLKYFYEKKDSKRTWIRLSFSGLVWFGLLGFMAGQIYWVFQLRFLYEQSSYALQFQRDYINEIQGTLNLNLSINIIKIQQFGTNLIQNAQEVGQSIITASVGQMITYLLGVIPIIDFILGLWKSRRTLVNEAARADAGSWGDGLYNVEQGNYTAVSKA